jgi:hypothetical protein
MPSFILKEQKNLKKLLMFVSCSSRLQLKIQEKNIYLYFLSKDVQGPVL